MGKFLELALFYGSLELLLAFAARGPMQAQMIVEKVGYRLVGEGLATRDACSRNVHAATHETCTGPCSSTPSRTALDQSATSSATLATNERSAALPGMQAPSSSLVLSPAQLRSTQLHREKKDRSSFDLTPTPNPVEDIFKPIKRTKAAACDGSVLHSRTCTVHSPQNTCSSFIGAVKCFINS